METWCCVNVSRVLVDWGHEGLVGLGFVFCYLWSLLVYTESVIEEYFYNLPTYSTTYSKVKLIWHRSSCIFSPFQITLIILILAFASYQTSHQNLLL